MNAARTRAAIAGWLNALGLLVVACHERRPVPPVTTQDSAGVPITTIQIQLDSVREWQLVEPPIVTIDGSRTGDSTAFAVIGAVRWIGNRQILAADLGNTKLYLFDSAGAYRRSFGRHGDGPGEFERIAAVSVLPGDSLYIEDPSRRRLSVWSPRSGYVRAAPIPEAPNLEAWPVNAWAQGPDRLVVLRAAIGPVPTMKVGEPVQRWQMIAHLTLHSANGELLARTPQFDGAYTGAFAQGDARLPFANAPVAAISPTRTVYGSGQRFALTILDSAFDRVREVRWPAMDEPLTEAEIAAVRSEIGLTLRGSPSRQRQVLDVTLAKAVLPKERPSIGRVILDSDERIWVERFEAERLGSPFPRSSDRWTILDRNGSPIGRLRLPSGTRLEAVDHDRVLAVTRDSLDVQHIVAYAVSRP